MNSSDSVYYIGDSHLFCQDYTVAGKTEYLDYYSILSDGCSGSPNSDIGSRLLCLSAKKHISEMGILDHMEFARRVKSTSYICASTLDVNPSVLDATLIVSSYNEVSRKFHVKTYGDGVIALRKKDGNFIIIVITSPEIGKYSFPLYINHMDNKFALDNYRAATKNQGVKFEIFGMDKSEDTLIRNYIEFDGIKFCEELQSVSIDGTSDEFDMVVTMSDGALSFFNQTFDIVQPYGKAIAFESVLNELLNFKNTSGLFVQRRMKAFRKFCKFSKWINFDDMSVSAIYFGE